ncbi:DUF3800 domain-containing protein [Kingella denitrificans]|uniref:DUF3800 domain-containing protein n=1 Tax=Kingella denitrificans TaxID=502 RepID=UPI0028E3EB2A|nr:DUF3800 domain-containing protein [Kingella denitrificans]
MKIYIDESGNTGDLIQNNHDLTFSNQEIFTLAAVKLPDTEEKELELVISYLKQKHKIQASELKTKKLFDNKSKFIHDLIEYISCKNIDYYIEIIDKKYYLCNSIVRHQVFPLVLGTEKIDIDQIIREIFTDILFNNLTTNIYMAFCASCRNLNKESLILSFNELLALCNNNLNHRSQEYLRDIYLYMKDSIKNTIDYFINKEKIAGNRVINEFIPIPDKNKKGYLIYLLPQISSLTNIIARVNFTNKSIKNIIFIHDNQVHFDEILINNSNSMINYQSIGFNFTNSEFKIHEKPNMKFNNNSKNSLGIQIADILSGFTMRYINKMLKNEYMEDIYHKIFNLLESEKNYPTINYMISISSFIKLNKKYNRGIEISEEGKSLENWYIQEYITRNINTLLK